MSYCIGALLNSTVSHAIRQKEKTFIIIRNIMVHMVNVKSDHNINEDLLSHCGCSDITFYISKPLGLYSMDRTVGVVECVNLCVFCILFLHFSLLFLATYSIVLYAHDFSCTAKVYSYSNGKYLCHFQNAG